jgi:hypothetical protein
MSYIKNIRDGGGCSSCKRKYKVGGCDCGTCMNDGNCGCAVDGRKRRRSRSRSKGRRSSKRRSRSSRRRRH